MSNGNGTVHATPATPRPSTIDRKVDDPPQEDEFKMNYVQTQAGDSQAAAANGTLAANSLHIGNTLVEATPCAAKENWCVENTPETRTKDNKDAPARPLLTPTLQVSPTLDQTIVTTPLSGEIMASADPPSKKQRTMPSSSSPLSQSVPEVAKTDSPVVGSPVVITTSKVTVDATPSPVPPVAVVVPSPTPSTPAGEHCEEKIEGKSQPAKYIVGQSVLFSRGADTEPVLGKIRSVNGSVAVVALFCRIHNPDDVEYSSDIARWALSHELYLTKQTEKVALNAIIESVSVFNEEEKRTVFFCSGTFK